MISVYFKMQYLKYWDLLKSKSYWNAYYNRHSKVEYHLQGIQVFTELMDQSDEVLDEYKHFMELVKTFCFVSCF